MDSASPGSGEIGTDISASPPNEFVLDSEDDDQDELYEEWDAVKINEDSPKNAPIELKCMRCPNDRVGTFTDPRIYWAHVKRHIIPDHFACPTCQRSFITLNFCLSHEIRVHNTQLDFLCKADVVKQAITYSQNRQERKKKSESEPHVSQKADGTESDTDAEDLTFYSDRIVPSTPCYPYRGPQIDTMLEAYEAQLAAERPYDWGTNEVAKIAIATHEQNVERGHDSFKLGRFLKRKRKPVAVVPTKPKHKPPHPTTTISTAKSIPPSPAATEPPKDATSQNDQTQCPGKKRKVVRYITSASSSSSSGTDSDASSQSYQMRMRFTALLKRKCRQCNFVWKDEPELRLHRDTFHSAVSLLELLSFPCRVSNKQLKWFELPRKSGVSSTDDSETSSTKFRDHVIPSDRHSNGTQKDGSRWKSCHSSGSSSKATFLDSTFSEKEVFLRELNLVSAVRLNLQHRKPVKSLQLPKCSVRMKRMSERQTKIYLDRMSSSRLDYIPELITLD